jgi:O-antigen/teichoic acid export membrane protein
MKSIKSVKWQSINAMANAIVNPLFIILLTSIFSPKQLGIIAVLTMIVSFAQKITNMGFAQAIIQAEEIDKKDLNTIFIFVVFIGVFLSLVLNIFATSIANFYEEESLISLIRYSSIIFILQPMASIFSTLLKKELEYNILTKNGLIGLVIQKSSILILAYLGVGTVSFPIGSIIGILVGNVLLLRVFKKSNLWIPKLEFYPDKLKKHFKFGIFVSLQSISNNVFYYIDEIIISTMFSMEILGLYYFVKNLFNNVIKIVDSTISQVMFPVFSKLQTHEKAFYNSSIKLIKIIALFILPISFGISLTGALFVPLLFGDEWINSIELISLMSFWSVLYLSTNVLLGPIYAKGKANWVFYSSIIEFPLRAGFLYFSASFGIQVFIMTLGVIQAFKYIFYIFLMKKLIQLKFKTVLLSVLPTYFATIVAYLVSDLLQSLFKNYFDNSMLLHLCAIGIIFISIYTILIYILDRGLVEFIKETVSNKVKLRSRQGS